MLVLGSFGGSGKAGGSGAVEGMRSRAAVDQVRDGLVIRHVVYFERVEPTSLEAVRAMFEWSELRTYSLNPPGKNPATLLGSRGWIPH